MADQKENYIAPGVRIFQAAPPITKANASKPRKSLAPIAAPLPVTNNMVPTMTFKKSPKRSPLASKATASVTKSYARPSASSLARAKQSAAKGAPAPVAVPAALSFPRKSIVEEKKRPSVLELVAAKRPRKTTEDEVVEGSEEEVALLSRLAEEGVRVDAWREGGRALVESWSAAQERFFTLWLNEVLCSQATASDTGLRKLLYLRRLAEARTRAAALLASPESQRVVVAFTKAVTDGKLTVRPDRELWADVGTRQNVVNLLMCYNPLWLHLGLETIYGRHVRVASAEALAGIMQRFLLNHLLFDGAISRAHLTPKGLHRPEFKAAMDKFTLSRLLQLVWFLDAAKTARVMEDDPCLFERTSKIKESSGLLLTFGKLYLSGDATADISRVLESAGARLSYRQSWLQEQELVVRNLAADLRDGVKLVRLVECVASARQDSTPLNLSSLLRTPPATRAQRIHNVGVALDALAMLGLTAPADPKHVVDGHRDKTLALLWVVLAHFQLPALIGASSLRREVAALRVRVSSVVLPVSDESSAIFIGASEEHLNVLLDWVKAVCAVYRERFPVRVNNFTQSFADGVALCLLIHHYLPSLLPLNAILTQDIVEESKAVDWSAGYASFSPPKSKAIRARNDHAKFLASAAMTNLQLVSKAIDAIGGIPSLPLPNNAASVTSVDEKIVVAVVAFLSSRLTIIRREATAAKAIQRAWRSYYKRVLLPPKTVAINVCTAVRARSARDLFNNIRTAVVFVQRRHRARTLLRIARHELALRAAIAHHVAASVRAKSARAHLRVKLYSVALIQRIWRVVRLVRHLHALHQRLAVQTSVRGFIARKEVHVTRAAVTRLQAVSHLPAARTEVARLHLRRLVVASLNARGPALYFAGLRYAALLLQASARSHEARAEFYQRTQAKFIQANYSRFVAHLRYCTKAAAATLIRAVYKGHVARIQHARRTTFARICASLVLAKQARTEYINTVASVVIVQSLIRAYQARCAYLAVCNSVCSLQASIRARLARSHAASGRVALRVQAAMYRSAAERQVWCARVARAVAAAVAAKTVRVRFAQQRHLGLVLQATVRSRQAYQQVLQWCATRHEAAICVQAMTRMFVARLRYTRTYALAKGLTSAVRGRTARLELHRAMGVRLIQNNCSVYLARIRQQRRAFITSLVSSFLFAAESRDTLQKGHLCLLVQSAARGLYARHFAVLQHEASIIIQTAYRAHAARIHGKHLRLAALIYAAVASRHAIAYATTKREAALTLQSYARSYACRQHFITVHTGAIAMQAAARGLQTRNLHRRLCVALAVQTQIRQRKAEEEAVRFIACATLMQKLWRGHHSRQLALRTRVAVTVQSFARMLKARKHAIEAHSRAVMLQSTWRGCIARRQAKKERLARTLQSQVRMVKQQRYFASQYALALLLEAAVHSQRDRKEFAFLRGVVAVQSATRRLLATRRYKGSYVVAAEVEAAVVARKDREHLLVSCAARVLQCAYRRCEAMEAFAELRHAAITVQRYYRAHVTRNRLHRLHAAIRIQAMTRMFVARLRYTRMQVLAEEGTSAARARTARLELHRAMGVRLIQNNCSVYLARIRQQRRAFITSLVSSFLFAAESRDTLQKGHLCLLVQSAVRGLFARRFAVLQHEASIAIETTYRAHAARSLLPRLRVATFVGAGISARYVRAPTAHKLALRTDFVASQMARLAREKFTMQRGIRAVQANIRTRLAQAHFMAVREAALTLQSYARSYACRQHFITVHTGAIAMQAAARGLQTRNLHRRLCVALAVQTQIRQRKAEEEAVRFIACATLMQKLWRGHHSRQLALRTRVAVTVQSFARMLKARKHAIEVHDSALLLQSVWRGYMARQLAKKERLARTLQSQVRMVKQQRYFASQYALALLLEAAVHSQRDRKEFAFLRGVVAVQAATRRLLALRRFADQKSLALQVSAASHALFARHRLERERAAYVLQRNVRGYMAREAYAELRYSAVVLQRAFRVRQARLYIHHLRCITIVQSYVRRYVARARYVRSRQLASVGSALISAHSARRAFSLGVACRDIQTNMRLCLTLAVLRCIDLRLRRLRVAEQVQAAARAFFARHELEDKHSTAIVLQTAWRAYSIRSNPGLVPLVAIRRRLARATATAVPERALGHRVDSALALLSSSRLSSLMQACNTLSLATLVSYAVADRLVQEGALAHLFRLIRSCNRSTPHMELIKLALEVLENVARQSTYAATLVEDATYVEVLVDLMQMYRDKEVLFRCTVAVLLAVCIRSVECRAILYSHTAQVKRMETVHALVERKLRLEAQYLQRHTVHMQAHRPYHAPLRDLLSLLGSQ